MAGARGAGRSDRYRMVPEIFVRMGWMTIRSMQRTCLLAGAAILAASPAAADVEPGFDVLSRTDDAHAIEDWKARAGRGDAEAQFNLAEAYKLGRGVPVDLAKAEELFGKAATQGHPQASENYGLLLFRRGEQARAIPYIKAAAGRGDPRSQYLLGVAHFNGDNVAQDWVRAYALVSLARAAGLPQAAAALTQMDKYIPLDQRQRSATLASELAAAAQAARRSQIAAAPASTAKPAAPSAPPRPASRVLERATAATPAPAQVAPPRSDPASAKPSAPSPAVVPASTGAWRVQLGAFGVPANAEALWNRVKARPELAGRTKLLVPAGRVAKLQAGGFASQDEAQEACSNLSAAGFSCLAVRN